MTCSSFVRSFVRQVVTQNSGKTNCTKETVTEKTFPTLCSSKNVPNLFGKFRSVCKGILTDEISRWNLRQAKSPMKSPPNNLEKHRLACDGYRPSLNSDERNRTKITHKKVLFLPPLFKKEVVRQYRKDDDRVSFVERHLV